MAASNLQSLLLALDSAGTTCRSYLRSGRHAVRRRMQKRRMTLLEGSRRPRSHLKRRIRALRKLVPAGESVELDVLFTEAAEYVACLRMQVHVMQVMVKVLSGDSDEYRNVSE